MAVILRVRVTLTYGDGGPGLATWYFAPGTVGGSTADANDVVGRVRTFWASLAPRFNTGFSSQVQSDVAAIEATTGALVGQFSAAPVLPVAGSAAGGIAPPVLMILLRSRTSVIINGRLLKGRHFLGPPAVAAIVSTGRVDPAFVAAFDTAANLIIPPGATTSAPAVWSRPTAGAGGGHGLITSYSAWDRFAELRSRRDA